MRSNVKRLLSMLLVIVMMLAALPMTTFALGEHEHTFEVVVKSPANCYDEGHTTYTCSVCGYKTREDYTPARHNFDGGVDEMPDDPEDMVYTVYTCKDCGATMEEAHHTHAYTEIIYDPTCVSAGYSKFKCNNCDYYYFQYDTTPATGHKWGEWIVTETATEDDKGEETRVCKTCGEKDVRPVDRLNPTAKTGKITVEFARIYKEPNTKSEITYIALKGSCFALEARDTAKDWYRISDEKWIPASSIDRHDTSITASPYAGAKYYGIADSAFQLKVRTGPSEMSTLISSLSSGSEIAIFTISRDDNGVQWGRISKTEEKWVDLTHVKTYKILDGNLPDGNHGSTPLTPTTTTTTTEAKVLASGTVTGAATVNVRKEPSVSVLTLKGSVSNGTKVDIYDTDEVNGHTWGYVKYSGGEGWICLDYVTLTAGSSLGGSSSSEGTSTVTLTPNATVVNCSTGVNVRENNDVYSSLVGTIPVSTRVAITDLDDGWGYVAAKKGWVYLQYISLDAGAEEKILNGDKEEEKKPNTVETPLPTYTNVSVPATAAASIVKVYSAPNAKTVVLTMYKDDEKIISVNDRSRDANGVQWGKISVGTVSGWVRIADLNLLEVTGAISVDSAKVYKEHNVDKDVVTSLAKGTTVTIVDQFTDSTYVWGKLKNVDGWIQMHNAAFSFKTDSSANNTGTPVSMTGKTGVAQVTMRKFANATSEMLVTLSKGTSLTITEWTTNGGICWGKTSFGSYTGWVNLDDVVQTVEPGTVTAESVNLYSSYTGTNVELVLRKGEKVNVLERVLYGNTIWGRINVDKKDYWGNLAGITLASAPVPTETAAPTTSVTPAPSTPSVPETSTSAKGTIVNCTVLNVRSAAGVGNAKVAELAAGSTITVYEQKTVDNALWGRTDKGWIAMMYVDLSSKTNTTGTTTVTNGTVPTSVPSGALAVGFVNTDNLNVRVTAAGDKVAGKTLAKGSGVTILNYQEMNGAVWGQTKDGWINLYYVTLTGIGTSGSGTTGTIKGCFYTANVRSGAGVANTVNGKVMVNSRVEILEQREYSGEMWGRTAMGWIAMQYVLIGEIPVI